MPANPEIKNLQNEVMDAVAAYLGACNLMPSIGHGSHPTISVHSYNDSTSLTVEFRALRADGKPVGDDE